LPHLSKHLVAVVEKLPPSLHPSGCWINRQDGRWRTTVDTSNGVTGGMVGGVVAIFHPSEPIHPCPRMITCNTT
jgi:hypothetical protein